MHQEILHLYGPFSIHSFGVFLVIGILVFTACFLNDKRRAPLLNTDQYFNLLSLVIVAGLLGGRLLFAITNWDLFKSWVDIFALWHGGFSLLGGVISATLTLAFVLYRQSLPLLKIIDLATVYVPLLQSIARIGCFFAGCCFGSPTASSWGFLHSACPVKEWSSIPLHPTQLYSSAALFLIFLFMRFLAPRWCTRPGQLACIYLFLIGAERFIIDFWRGDREWITSLPFSWAQAIGLLLCAASILGFWYLQRTSRGKPS